MKSGEKRSELRSMATFSQKPTSLASKVTGEPEVDSMVKEIIEKKFKISIEDTLNRKNESTWVLKENIDGLNIYLNSRDADIMA